MCRYEYSIVYDSPSDSPFFMHLLKLGASNQYCTISTTRVVYRNLNLKKDVATVANRNIRSIPVRPIPNRPRMAFLI